MVPSPEFWKKTRPKAFDFDKRWNDPRLLYDPAFGAAWFGVPDCDI